MTTRDEARVREPEQSVWGQADRLRLIVGTIVQMYRSRRH